MVKSNSRKSPRVKIGRVSRACVLVVTFQNILPFNTAESQEQRPSGKTNTTVQNKPSYQSKHWLAIKTPPWFTGKEKHRCRYLHSLSTGGLALLLSFLAFGVLSGNLYLNIGDRRDLFILFICLFGVFFLFLWLLKTEEFIVCEMQEESKWTPDERKQTEEN